MLEIDMTAFKQLILTNTGDKDVLTDRQNQTVRQLKLSKLIYSFKQYY